MAGPVYILCAATAFLCAWLLLRAYATSGYSLLFWSGLCFVGLTLNNLLVVADRLIFPDLDLSILRLIPALAGMALLLFGLIWHGE